MNEADPVFQERLENFKHERTPKLAIWFAIAGMASFILFYWEDRNLLGDNQEALRTLLYIRTVVVACLLGVIMMAFQGPTRKAGQISGVSCYLVNAIGVSFVTAFCGGGITRYHEALGVTIFAYGAFIPTTTKRAFIWGAGLIAFHHGLLWAKDVLGSADLAGTNFLSLALCLATSCIGVQVINDSRKRELIASIERDTLIKELSEKNAEKDRGFANISSEIRTPLSLIRVPLDAFLKKRRNLDEPGRRQLEGCYENTRRLAVLVDELVDLISLEGSKKQLSTSSFDLADQLRLLVAQVVTSAQRRDISLQFLPKEEEVLELTADKRLIDRVCLNLLTNALKFTDEKGCVSVNTYRRDGRVYVEIRDTGIGIRPEDTERIFRPYVQIETKGRKNRGGAGVGLTLAKEMVERHGGQLTVSSVLGEGSCFTFWIPDSLASRSEEEDMTGLHSRPGKSGLEAWGEEFRERDEYRLQELRRVTERRALKRTAPPDALKILIVDADESVWEMFNSLLEGEYNIFTAGDGKRGLSAVDEYRPDLVIASVSLPKMTGDEMVRELRKTKFGARVPIIALMAASSPAQERDMAAARVDGFLTLPFESEALYNIIDAHLTRQAEVKSAAEDERWAALRLQAGSAAHEVLNPLQAVSGKFFFIEEELSDAKQSPSVTDALTDNLNRIGSLTDAARMGVERAVKAVETLQRISRGTEDQEPFSISYIASVAQAVLIVVDSQQTIVRDLASVRPFLAQRDAISRVLINLIKNAQEACQGLASTRIEVRAWDDDEKGRIYVTIKDNGPGISKEAQGKIFDPWYTTKQLGTGLGLHVCREIIARHEGALLVDSDVGKGATFTIVLPTAASPERDTVS